MDHNMMIRLHNTEMMMSTKSTLLAVTALAILAMMAPSYAAPAGATVITIETQDTPGGHMALKSSHQTVSAGEVTFVASNVSVQGKDHEVLMIKTDLEPKDLPMTADGKAIDEKKLSGIVELGDIGPGNSNQTKVTLEPGSYLLFCNLPGHTGAGMWSRLNSFTRKQLGGE
jgi:uncharacterized cupredoxin-like copper-binding protein